MGELLSQAQYAEHRKARGLAGQTRAAVSKAVKEGRCPIVRDAGGKVLGIDPAEADRAWDAKAPANPGAPVNVRRVVEPDEPPDTPKGKLNLTEAQTEHANIKTQLARLDYDKRRGLLIEREAVVSTGFAAARLFRDQLLGLPRKLAHRLANVSSPAEIEAELEYELVAIVAEIKRKLQDLAASADEAGGGPGGAA